jgi:hypothetical protein
MALLALCWVCCAEDVIDPRVVSAVENQLLQITAVHSSQRDSLPHSTPAGRVRSDPSILGSAVVDASGEVLALHSSPRISPQHSISLIPPVMRAAAAQAALVAACGISSVHIKGPRGIGVHIYVYRGVVSDSAMQFPPDMPSYILQCLRQYLTRLLLADCNSADISCLVLTDRILKFPRRWPPILASLCVAQTVAELGCSHCFNCWRPWLESVRHVTVVRLHTVKCGLYRSGCNRSPSASLAPCSRTESAPVRWPTARRCCCGGDGHSSHCKEESAVWKYASINTGQKHRIPVIPRSCSIRDCMSTIIVSLFECIPVVCGGYERKGCKLSPAVNFPQRHGEATIAYAI